MAKSKDKPLTEKQEAKPFGRPPKYSSPDEMQKLIDLYFLICRVHQTGDASYLGDLIEEELLIVNDIEDTYPSISGLAYTLGMSTEAFRNYEQKDNFLATVKRAKQRVEMSLEQRLAQPACTGSIFSLKNNFGWKDKTEQEISGHNGGPIETKTVLNFVPVNNKD